MKKSELKDYIKEQIIGVLSEASSEDVENQKAYNDELEKTNDLMSKMKMEEDEDVDAPAGDQETQKKASKQDIIVKDYNRLRKELKTHLEMYKDAEGDQAKEAALKMMKKISQSAEYIDSKEKYEKLKKVKE